MHASVATSILPRVSEAANARLRLLFCHGLGSAKSDIIANQIQQWASQKEIHLETNYGDSKHVWDINDWRKDIAINIKDQMKHSNHFQQDYSKKFQKTIVVCNSAASQAFLRAFVDLCGEMKAESMKDSLAGLLMIAPGVGMNLANYMERLMPGSLKDLKNGQHLKHPTADPTLNIQVNMKCLEEFVNNCVIRQCEKIPLVCPVRIIHGIYDKLVPYRNSLELLDKITTKDKAIYLINDGHFVKVFESSFSIGF